MLQFQSTSSLTAQPRETRAAAGTPPWCTVPLRERVRRVCALRHRLAEDAAAFLNALRTPPRTNHVESIAGEMIPLADACAFIEKNAEQLLRTRRLGRSGRPLWLWGVDAEVRREPLGKVLIIGPANYPLMLPGIQIVQALVAGNDVLFKPAPGTRPIASLLCDTLHALGVPRESLELLDEDPQAAQDRFTEVDKVFMTGSESSGKAVLRQLADHGVPAVMELSGCDAVFVLPGADLPHVARALRFGLTFNASATCMAPRRVFVRDADADPLLAELTALLRDDPPQTCPPQVAAKLSRLAHQAIAAGATVASGNLTSDGVRCPLIVDRADASMALLQEDVMAPVLSIVRVPTMEAALSAYEQCPYRLGASVFGPTRIAHDLARRISAGSVIVNDLIVPSADPRLALGGQGRSGFGVTRGPEGLFEMTRLKTISVRHGTRPLHLRPDADEAGGLLLAYVRATHGRSLFRRLAFWIQLAREGRLLSGKHSTPR